MLYTKSVFANRYVVPELDFTSYFKRYYNALPSLHDLLASGCFKSCTGTVFVQSENDVFEATFFDEVRKVNIISWTTKNFKGEDRVCATALFELLPDGTCYLWNIAFTTCDPFFFDNFSQPLGIDFEDSRASFNPKTGAITLHNHFPPVENRVFFVNKITFMKARMDQKILESRSSFLTDLRELAMTSRNMDRVFLRMILERYSTHVPTAETIRDRLSAAGQACTPEGFEELKTDELAVLRGIVKTLAPQQFYDLYMSTLDGLLDYPVNLLPEEYKKFGRRLLMFKDDCDAWDRVVFLLMLSARAKLVIESPFDASLGLGSGARVFVEVSDDDARFAEKTPKDPTDPKKKVKLGDVGPNWILRMTERVVAQQEGFLEELKDLIDKQDIEGALRKLTDGTATPREGQGLLGLSINLLRAFTAKVISFPVELEDAIKTMFSHYNINWSLPLLSVGVNSDEARTTHGIDLLLKLGAPVRDVASD